MNSSTYPASRPHPEPNNPLHGSHLILLKIEAQLAILDRPERVIWVASATQLALYKYIAGHGEPQCGLRQVKDALFGPGAIGKRELDVKHVVVATFLAPRVAISNARLLQRRALCAAAHPAKLAPRSASLHAAVGTARNERLQVEAIGKLA